MHAAARRHCARIRARRTSRRCGRRRVCRIAPRAHRVRNTRLVRPSRPGAAPAGWRHPQRAIVTSARSRTGPFGGRLLRFRGEPGPQRRREPAPWPDMPQPPDVRLPHQDALSHASTEQPAAAMAITPGAHMAGGPRSGAGIPRRAWPAAAPCARALARHAATPGRALAASGCVIPCPAGAACPRTPAPGPAHAFGGGITDAPGRIARRRRRGGCGHDRP